MTKLMAVKMRQLLSLYTPNIVEEAVKNKKDIILKNYIEKGWNYCYAIIENEAARLSAENKVREREKRRVIIEYKHDIQIVDYQKQENRDISAFLEE